MRPAWRYVTVHSGNRPIRRRAEGRGTLVTGIGPRGGTGHLNDFRSRGLTDHYAVPARTAGADFAIHVSPVTIIFHAMRAVLLASATAANFGDLRLRSSTSHGDAFPLRRACWITAVAPTTNTLRNPSSPARVITPSLTLPAVECEESHHTLAP
jgi:hypothetical protein